MGRNTNLLGIVWIILGVVVLTRGIFIGVQHIVDPSASPKDWLDRVIGMPIVAIIHFIGGLVILRQHPIARPFIAISSLLHGTHLRSM